MAEAIPSEPIQIKDAVISAQHLTKKFRDETAVEDVSFDVPRASIFGFIGPSGSGKTTTVRLLTGVYTPTTGEVSVLDRSPAKFSQSDRARLGYMPLRCDWHLTASLEYCPMKLRAHRRARNRRRQSPQQSIPLQWTPHRPVRNSPTPW